MQFHPQYAETVKRLEEALNSPRLFIFGRVNTWLSDGALPDEIIDVCTRVAKRGRWSGSNLSYFDGFIADAIAARTKPMPEAKPRADSEGVRRPRTRYEPPPERTPDEQDRLDRLMADLVNKNMAPMSVTYQDAQRMHKRGWLTPEAAERFGLRKDAV